MQVDDGFRHFCLKKLKVETKITIPLSQHFQGEISAVRTRCSPRLYTDKNKNNEYALAGSFTVFVLPT